MPPLTLRTLIGTIGIAVCHQYNRVDPFWVFSGRLHEHGGQCHLRCEPKFQSRRRLDVTDQTLWHNQRVHIAELIELPAAHQVSVRQRVYDGMGLITIRERRPTRRSDTHAQPPIVVPGTAVGRMKVEQPAFAA